MNANLLFQSFIAYSFLGWLIESTYVSVTSRRWVNRGFLNGPVCPIYGVGALLILSILYPLREMALLVFLGGAIVCSLLEFLTSLGMERLFGNRWWDYSDKKFNLQGRICLSISLAWGVLSLFLIYGLEPVVTQNLARIPDLVKPWLSLVLAITLMADLVFSILAIVQISRLAGKVGQWMSVLKDRQDTLVHGLQVRSLDTAHAVLDLLETLRERNRLIQSLGFAQRRLLKAFPLLHSIHYPQAFSQVREWLGEHRPNFPDLPRPDLSRLKLQARFQSPRIPEAVSHRFRHLVSLAQTPLRRFNNRKMQPRKRPPRI